MASPAVIGALRIVLGADTAALEKGLKDAHGSLASFGKSMATTGAVIGAAMVAVGAAVAVAVRHSITEADKLGKMAQKIGVPVEELSALSLAAALSDISMESLGKSVGKLSKAMVEAAAKPTSDAANAFKALGVSVVESDGKLKSSTTVIADIAGKFEGLKDGAGKTAVAMALFGKSGTEMIPLLNAGKAGLKEMTDEAAQLGLVIDKHTSKSAEAFNDNLTRLGKVKDGIILKITVGMLPALENLSANMVRVAKDSDGLRTTGEAVGSMMTGLFSIIAHVSLGWQRLGIEWGALREFMKTDVFGGKLTENWEKFNAVGAESTRQFEALRITLETAHLADAFGAISVKTGEAAKKQDDFNYAAMAGKNALNSFIDSSKKAMAQQAADTASTGAAIGLKEQLRIVLQANEVAIANQIKMTPALTAEITALGIAARDSALNLAGARMTEESLAPWQKHIGQIQEIQQLYAAGVISAGTMESAMRKTAESAGTAWDIAGASIAGSMSDIAKSFGKENSAMATAAKIFGAIQATISMFTGAAKALELPFPANIAAMATVLAKGAAFVASIRSQAIPKFAQGGSFQIGGSGGVDSQMVPIMATPGEQVHVEQNKYGEGSGGRTLNLNVQGETFGRDTLRKIAKGIEDLVGDGLQVNLSPA